MSAECMELNSNEKAISLNEKCLMFNAEMLRLWKRPAPKKMIKITTSTGNELIITDNHPLFTTCNGLVYAKAAKEFIEKEYIALPSKIVIKGSIQNVSFDITPSKANNKVKYKCKQIVDE